MSGKFSHCMKDASSDRPMSYLSFLDTHTCTLWPCHLIMGHWTSVGLNLYVRTYLDNTRRALKYSIAELMLHNVQHNAAQLWKCIAHFININTWRATSHSFATNFLHQCWIPTCSSFFSQSNFLFRAWPEAKLIILSISNCYKTMNLSGISKPIPKLYGK